MEGSSLALRSSETLKSKVLTHPIRNIEVAGLAYLCFDAFITPFIKKKKRPFRKAYVNILVESTLKLFTFFHQIPKEGTFFK